MFTRRDLFSSIVAGLITGFSAWRIFEFLEIPPAGGISFAWLLVIIPVLWIAGVNLGYFLGKFFAFFRQFGKFAAIGFTNAAVDFGILYFLIAATGEASGIYYTVFKTISFLIANAHSYLWNKFWVFDAAATTRLAQEITKFFAVSVSAAVINVLAASLVVNVIGPQFGMTAEAWAGMGAVVGSATALIVSFTGFKILVFKR